MIFLFCLCQILVIVSSDIPPLAPLNIELVDQLLKWTPAEEDRNTTYTVQYSWPNDEDKWKNVTWCVQMGLTSCDVNSIISEFDCVKLRVQAQRNGLTSETVEACCRKGDCTPQVRLSSQAGSLTVHMSWDHDQVRSFADHAQYEVCYGRLGQALQFRRSKSSVVLRDLDEGQTYCVQVQFLLFSKPVGVPSCSQCLDIPYSRVMSKTSWIIVAAVISFVALAVASLVAYMIIFHRKKFKRWLRPEQMPYSLTLPLHDVLVSSPVEEHCSSIIDFISRDQND